MNPIPFKCPVCNGMTKVSRPPHIAGDVEIHTTSSTEIYPCPACTATGVVWSVPDAPKPKHEHLDFLQIPVRLDGEEFGFFLPCGAWLNVLYRASRTVKYAINGTTFEQVVVDRA